MILVSEVGIHRVWAMNFDLILISFSAPEFCSRFGDLLKQAHTWPKPGCRPRNVNHERFKASKICQSQTSCQHIKGPHTAEPISRSSCIGHSVIGALMHSLQGWYPHLEIHGWKRRNLVEKLTFQSFWSLLLSPRHPILLRHQCYGMKKRLDPGRWMGTQQCTCVYSWITTTWRYACDKY